MGFFEMFFHASFFVKLIILTLISLSVLSWTLYIHKSRVIKRELQNLAEVTNVVQKESILDLHTKIPDNSIGLIVLKTSKQANTSVARITTPVELEVYKSRINCVSETVIYNYEKMISKRVSWLATVSSISPYIGLLGTVWGILDTFNKISGVKVVTLQTVAPGISEALVATAIGLAATIPAYVFYNSLQSKISTLLSDIEKLNYSLVTSVTSMRMKG